jgi:RNA-directed DNA polymerase
MAETQADPNSYGFRPKRRCADALDQGFKVLRQSTSASGSLAGDSEGFFAHIAFSWIEEHMPMKNELLAKGLRCGVLDHGPRYPTPGGVPQGGIISPAISNLGREGLAQVVWGPPRCRRRPHLHGVRWADDFLVTANARQI